MRFPETFTWGAAASSYQIEGAAHEDGRGLSVWDVFCRRPGATWQGHNGDEACDHYHRYGEDVALMRELGLRAYRFSIAWPRIFPEGTGQVNQRGLDFYDRLVDALLAAGIQPWATLFHWDYPYALYCRGGWLNRESADWFAAYAEAVVRRIGDRVKHWITINEPQVVGMVGHFWGVHAPGDKLLLSQVLQINHHMLLAHGKAAQAIRAVCHDCQIGVAPSGPVGVPASDAAEDVEAARRATFTITERSAEQNTLWLDPVFLGRYPQDAIDLFGDEMPGYSPDDMAIINQRPDFFGVNIYQGAVMRHGANGQPQKVAPAHGSPMTLTQWPVTPEALYWGPRFFYERYRTPIVITENGMSNLDWVGADGRVHDPQRIEYLRAYLRCLGRAIADGVDVRGYFHWSVMDNFEWADGYKQRFGLIHVDYATQRRTLKQSAYWYRDLIRSNGAEL